jgi:hypothetical protein
VLFEFRDSEYCVGYKFTDVLEDLIVCNFMECSSEMSVDFYQTTRRYNPEDNILQDLKVCDDGTLI